SRQRSWGVPIMVYACNTCGEAFVDENYFKNIVEKVKEVGCDIWFDDEENLLPDGATCGCGSKEFSKVKDILDVWFDSGVSHDAVLRKWEELSWPADLYLEGSDQHRGWFQSSLLASTSVNGTAPFKGVLTHGYVVDGQGKKMSKSQGNVIAPDEIIKQYGAEIIRLWVISENYREDLRISKNIIASMSDAYRKIRNTFRFILGNISDFNPATESVAFEEMDGLDRYILARLTEVINIAKKSYESYDFHVIYHSVLQYCIVDLSNFYLDILKDRLYTLPKKSKGRLSSQTALYLIADSLAKILAPVCPFTMEEVWSYLPSKEKNASIHFEELPELSYSLNDEERNKWETKVNLKKDVSKALEEARREKVIGHSLDAKVELHGDENLLAQLKAFGEDGLQSVFITSQVVICDTIDDAWKSVALEGVNVEGLLVKVSPGEGEKCERCWMKATSVGENSEHPTVCKRCSDALAA
ncbi:MAG: class I tRNA ligase family protein, partial [Nitrospinae bacterium]|nr:class I tRNA ligase family protein [Nitrospinota bacterium]